MLDRLRSLLDKADNGVQEAGSSNLLTQTMKNTDNHMVFGVFSLYLSSRKYRKKYPEATLEGPRECGGLLDRHSIMQMRPLQPSFTIRWIVPCKRC